MSCILNFRDRPIESFGIESEPGKAPVPKLNFIDLTFRAISHSHAYLEQYISLCTEASYEQYQWLYPGTFQPLQAVSSLLIDMSEYPTSNEAQISRRLIDRVFSLLNHEQGVAAEYRGILKQRRLSASGREAWRMLWKLRRRVWIDQGLNPAAQWTCKC